LHDIVISEYNNAVTQLGVFKSEFFKALAHPLRIAIIDALREGELGVNELCKRLSVEQSTISQQLAVLRSRNIVAGRKEGLNVYYSVRDTTVFKLLDVAKQIFNNQLIGVKDMLKEMAQSGGRRH
jgi:DNA-binding transcriptional ArsR family regulator